jgi:hypothetical protein
VALWTETASVPSAVHDGSEHTSYKGTWSQVDFLDLGQPKAGLLAPIGHDPWLHREGRARGQEGRGGPLKSWEGCGQC